MAKHGDPVTKKLTTGRFYLRRPSETSWLDFGNVADYKTPHDIQRAEHMSSSRGFKQTDFALVKSVKWLYELTLDEHSMPEVRNFLLLGKQGADVQQAAGNVSAEALTASSKKGRTYFAQAQGLSAVVVKVGATPYVEGVDYTVDLGSGAITILPASTIPDASAVTVDYTKALVVKQPYTALNELRVEGACRLVEIDQFAEAPRAVHDFTGQVQVTNWGDNNLEDYNKITLQVLCVNKPVVTYRKD